MTGRIQSVDFRAAELVTVDVGDLAVAGRVLAGVGGVAPRVAPLPRRQPLVCEVVALRHVQRGRRGNEVPQVVEDGAGLLGRPSGRAGRRSGPLQQDGRRGFVVDGEAEELEQIAPEQGRQPPIRGGRLGDPDSAVMPETIPAAFDSEEQPH